ncbi:MAG: translation initiation factor 2 alpha subunit (eIF-2alpha) [Patescibacteria group bacterium]|jgi:translation initiation factor 2 alpha subunit (eIF-2alpha)
MRYQEDDVVLCTVDSVDNNICFAHLPDGTKGTIISSEIAPGRIKFMRQYVVPKKRIVCKVLSVSNDNISLSLRRVNAKERKDVMQSYKQELANKTALKQILKDKYPETEKAILEDYDDLPSFIEESRGNSKIIAKYIEEQFREQVQKITEKRKKEIAIKYEIELKMTDGDGVTKIKDLFKTDNEKIKITYISAGKFLVRLSTEDFKTGKREITEYIENLQATAKKLNYDFSFKEAKK